MFSETSCDILVCSVFIPIFHSERGLLDPLWNTGPAIETTTVWMTAFSALTPPPSYYRQGGRTHPHILLARPGPRPAVRPHGPFLFIDAWSRAMLCLDPCMLFLTVVFQYQLHWVQFRVKILVCIFAYEHVWGLKTFSYYVKSVEVWGFSLSGQKWKRIPEGWNDWNPLGLEIYIKKKRELRTFYLFATNWPLQALWGENIAYPYSTSKGNVR